MNIFYKKVRIIVNKGWKDHFSISFSKQFYQGNNLNSLGLIKRDIHIYIYIYKICLESIEPFWICWELVTVFMQLGNQSKGTLLRMHEHSPMGLLSWQWDVTEWTCILCDCHIYNDISGRVFLTTQYSGMSSFQSRFDFLWFLGLLKVKIAIEREKIFNCGWN